jgi:hypothetical protein
MKKFTLFFIAVVVFSLFYTRSIDAQGVAINTNGNSPSTMLHVANGSTINNVLGILRIDRNNTTGGADAAANIGSGLQFYLEGAAAGSMIMAADINVTFDAVTTGSEEGSIAFRVAKVGTMTEIMRIDGSGDGNVGIGAGTPGAKLDVVSSTATGTGENLVVNSLTSGKGSQISSTATAFTGSMLNIDLSGNNVANTGNILNISSSGATSIARGINMTIASTGNLGTSGGGAYFNFSGAHTGNGFQIDDVTATGNAMKLTANSITSGSAMVLASSATAFTGTLVDLSLTGSNAANTGTVFKVTSSGIATAGVAAMVTNLGANASTCFRVNDETGDADATPFIIIGNGNVGIGTTTPDALLVVRLDDASTNTIIPTSIVSRSSSGVVANGIGTRLEFDVEDAGGIAPQGNIDVSLIDVTNASEDSKMEFVIKTAGASKALLSLEGTNAPGGGVVRMLTGVQIPNRTVTGAAPSLTEADYYIAANRTAAGDMTISLPDPTTVAGQVYIIKRLNATDATKDIIIDTPGAETIDGAVNYTITTQYDRIVLISDGTNWHRID